MLPKERHLMRIGIVSQYWSIAILCFSQISPHSPGTQFHRQLKCDLTLKMSYHSLSPFVNIRGVTTSRLGIMALVTDPQWCCVLNLVTSFSQSLPVKAARTRFLSPWICPQGLSMLSCVSGGMAVPQLPLWPLGWEWGVLLWPLGCCVLSLPLYI